MDVQSGSGGVSGIVSIMSGVGGDTLSESRSGDVFLGTGGAIESATGSLHLTTGTSLASAAGSIGVIAGATASGDGSAIQIEAGMSAGDSNANGGAMSIQSGGSDIGNSGAVSITSGSSVVGMAGASSGAVSMVSDSSAGDANTGTVRVGSGMATSAGSTGDVRVSSGSSRDGNSGNVIVEAGDSLNGGSGGNVKIQSGARTGGDASSSIQLHGGSGGGSVTVQPGVGPGEDQKGSFEVRDGSTEPRVIIDGAGKVALSSSIDQDFSATAGADLVLNATGELRVGHSESTSLRVRPDKIIPHVSVLMSDVTSPADTRIIADDTSGGAIDRDALLQQVMKVPLQSFTFTEEWRHMQGMGERTVRAAIGQEVVDIMPDWVNVVDELSFPEKGFALQKFHEVNDRQVLYDTLVSLQAMHRRFRVGEKSDTSSGQLDITTADAGSIAEMTDGARSSGSIRVATGSARQLGERCY